MRKPKVPAHAHAVKQGHLARAKLHLKVALDSLHEAKRCIDAAGKSQQAFKAKSLLHGLGSLHNDVIRSTAYHERHGTEREPTT